MIDTTGIISRGIDITNEDIVIQDNFGEEESRRARDWIRIYHTTRGRARSEN